MIIKRLTVQSQVYDIVTKGGSLTGKRKRLYITNTNDSLEANLDLYLEDGSAHKYYFLNGTIIPSNATLELEIIPFDSSVFHLRAVTASSSPAIHIIYG